ncbi:MAG: Gfo/Idh/MocA family oxidoreductase [Planctomycetaceae bacterium]|nr:Gfo/Idh/MocA family oxidoreductase [Planctomycetaceae bacterium]
MIKLAMIGLGGMGHHHAGILSKMPNVKITGVCDLIEDKAKSVSKITGAPYTLKFRELLAGCDAVWVCTEPFNRVEIVTAAAAAGKHIFTEKPICISPDDADTMIAAAEKAGVTYMLGYVLRYTQPYRIMRDTLASGELGDLVTAWTRRFMPFDMSVARWYGHQETSGGVVLDFGSHDINWLQWLGGPVKNVMCFARQIQPKMDAQEHGLLMMNFANGGAASTEMSWWSHLSESSVGVVGTKGAIIVGRDGAVRKKLDGSDEQVLDVQAATAIDPSGNLGQRDQAGKIARVDNPNETIQQHFFRCVEQGLTPITSARDGRDTLRLYRAAMESARTGKSVEL